ncbi:unnamed protein product [Closterium sp. NIES-65]|nr:unnamed protein product [Closterium sp. NIES-65]
MQHLLWTSPILKTGACRPKGDEEGRGEGEGGEEGKRKESGRAGGAETGVKGGRTELILKDPAVVLISWSWWQHLPERVDRPSFQGWSIDRRRSASLFGEIVARAATVRDEGVAGAGGVFPCVAAKGLANDKSPGWDGLPKELYQWHWELLREPVMKMIGEFAAAGKMPDVANEAVTILRANHDEESGAAGLSLALYLFLCAVEPLCRLAEERKLGIGEGTCDRLSYVGYADDTTLLLEGEEQLKDAGALLQEYAEVLGLRVNKGNSVVLPLGRNVGLQAPDGMEYKWVGVNEVERLLGVWIFPGGDAEATWEKAFDRAGGELSKWSTKYVTTGARVTIINSYVLPIFLFQAQVYPPDDLLWKRVEKLIENFMSGIHADPERHFRLWSGDLIYTPREQGGLGVIDLRGRIDSVAMRCAGLGLQQECSLRRGLSEKPASLPLGWATLYAHKAVLRGGLFKSRRWARLYKTILISTVVAVPEVASRWEAKEEFLCYNKYIIHPGNAPFGRS